MKVGGNQRKPRGELVELNMDVCGSQCKSVEVNMYARRGSRWESMWKSLRRTYMWKYIIDGSKANVSRIRCVSSWESIWKSVGVKWKSVKDWCYGRGG